MSLTKDVGRLGNQILRNIALSILAEKHDLVATYSSRDKVDRLGIPLYSGTKSFPYAVAVTDKNFFYYYRQESVLANLDLNADYFQEEHLTAFFMQYLQSSPVKESIQSSNPFRNRYAQNNDGFLHLRLGDTSQWALPLSYYLTCLSSISFETLYLSTDSPDHSYIQQIQQAYPQAILLSYDEIDTVQFGSTCSSVVLSHGSFSALIGYLAFHSRVFYWNHPVPWAPLGLLSGKGWTGIDPAENL